MGTTTVAFVTIRYEEVEVPSKCPGCSKDLTAAGTLRALVLEDAIMYGQVDEPGFAEFEHHSFGDEFDVCGIVCSYCDTKIPGTGDIDYQGSAS